MDRTAEDVEIVIRHAKLKTEDLRSSTQVLSFRERLMDGNEVKLLEVPKALMSEILNTGDSSLVAKDYSAAVIRGESNDAAVLCTKNKTYEIREAETSNSLLILQNLQIINNNENCRELVPKEIFGVFHRYLEIKECKPRLNKLFILLRGNLYSGRHSSNFPEGLSLMDLLDIVQCSESELKVGLRDIQACEIQGRWFLLDQDYQMKILSLICNYIEEQSWASNQIRKDETVEILGELEMPEVVAQVFDMFLDLNPDDDQQNYSMNEKKVCRFFGDYLLGTGTQFDLKEFEKMWAEAVPEGFKTSLDLLSGLALIKDSTIRSFQEPGLPAEIHERLGVLFSAKEKWTLEEIRPYIEKLTTPLLNVNALLTKYARTSNVNGVKYFSSKHGK